jgi:hypothetical protein
MREWGEGHMVEFYAMVKRMTRHAPNIITQGEKSERD